MSSPTTYKSLILIDRDGQETRDERRTMTEGRLAFTSYLENATADKKTFSVTLIDLVQDRIVSRWERGSRIATGQ